MKPMIELGRTVSRDGSPLVLLQRDEDFYLQINGDDLMFSRQHGSEEDLATLALAGLPARSAPRVLIGGLGMGYTLRAVLNALVAGGFAKDTQVVVAELFEAVVTWNRGVLGPLAGHPLEDKRVKVEVADVQEVIRAAAEGRRPAFDAILLDVDNGPDAFVVPGNTGLYSPEGLARLRAALNPGGVLAIWSAFESPPFVKRLTKAHFDASAKRVRARDRSKGGRHIIFLARRKEDGHWLKRGPARPGRRS